MLRQSSRLSKPRQARLQLERGAPQYFMYDYQPFPMYAWRNHLSGAPHAKVGLGLVLNLFLMRNGCAR